jgi:NTP pyrophosphatase (non-canonical NTP hydrolase)
VNAATASLIRRERERQIAKFGPQPLVPSHREERGCSRELYLAILTEEVGEVARAVIDIPRGECLPADLLAELVQVAAVAVAWLEAEQEAS